MIIAVLVITAMKRLSTGFIYQTKAHQKWIWWTSIKIHTRHVDTLWKQNVRTGSSMNTPELFRSLPFQFQTHPFASNADRYLFDIRMGGQH